MIMQRAIKQGCDLGLIEMKSTGRYGLTRDGQNFLDLLDALRHLDNRPGTARGSSPLAAGSPRAATPGGDGSEGARPGDDDRTARETYEQTSA